MQNTQIPVVSLGKALQKADKVEKNLAKTVFLGNAESIANLIVGSIKDDFNSSDDGARKEARQLAIAFKDNLFQKLPVAEPDKESGAQLTPEMKLIMDRVLADKKKEIAGAESVENS